MEKEDIGLILESQRKYFDSGKTLDINSRLENLKKLRSLILSHEDDLIAALRDDFSKPAFETIATESRFTMAELNLMIRKLRKWTGKRRVRTSLVNFIASSYIVPQPYGQVLIMSPWNFPFMLAMIPAMSALAAGNCVVLKVSQQTPSVAAVIGKILNNFPRDLIALVTGDHSVSNLLLEYKFDYIFFTGSQKIGKQVMAKAAVNLIPVSLELGGKNPCVVTADAKLDFAAKRIAWGKFINAGQTCIAPDYLLIDNKVKERFLVLIINEIKTFYGDDPAESSDFCRIISESSSERLTALLKNGNIIAGGKTDPANRFVTPTIITDVGPDDPIMQDEIFGPLLPVISYDKFSEIFQVINRSPKSLSAYIFTRSRKLAREFLSKTQSGSAAVNDTVMQIASPGLPFGGIGPSGMGRYHGRKSIETFSNMRSVMEKSNLVDIFVRYPPYTRFKENVIKLLMR